MMKRLMFVVIVLVLTSVASADLYGPTSYFSFADSPFNGLSFISFHLEDFEDGSLNVPGVTASAGNVIPPGYEDLIDSVDADDGTIDGSGSAGHSWFHESGTEGITFTFTEGSLPTHAGIVWTDGDNPITFEAFDASNNSLGTITGNHATFGYDGATSSDRFYGASDLGGISKIYIKSGGTVGIEVDHLQYGVVPVPGAVLLGILGLGVAGWKLRKFA